MPDGRRVTIETGGIIGKMRYWSEGENSFIEGDLTFEQHDARFTPFPKYRHAFGGVDEAAYQHLSDDIESDDSFVDFIRTSAGALALYRVLSQEDPTHLLTGEHISDLRSSAALVARIRNLGENYCDFFVRAEGAADRSAAEFVRHRLSLLGWLPVGHSEIG
jgi:hypothetical protein